MNRLWFWWCRRQAPLPEDFENWPPLGQELWHIIAAPHFDRAALQAALERHALTQAPLIVRAAGAATELDYYSEEDV